MSRRILPFPFRLPESVGFIGFLDVGKDKVDRFLDGAFTYAHGCDEHVHEGRFVVNIIPISEFHSVQVDGECGEDGLAHGRLVHLRHL